MTRQQRRAQERANRKSNRHPANQLQRDFEKARSTKGPSIVVTSDTDLDQLSENPKATITVQVGAVVNQRKIPNIEHYGKVQAEHFPMYLIETFNIFEGKLWANYWLVDSDDGASLSAIRVEEMRQLTPKLGESHFGMTNVLKILDNPITNEEFSSFLDEFLDIQVQSQEKIIKELMKEE